MVVLCSMLCFCFCEMEWDNAKCLQLLDLYEERTLLWDSKHPAYFNKRKKHDAWMEMCKIMRVGEDDLKKKMNSLLGSFRRERSRQRQSMSTEEGRKGTYKSRWFAFEKLQFLLKSVPMGPMDAMVGEEDGQSAEEQIDESALNGNQYQEINEKPIIQGTSEDGAGCSGSAESFSVPKTTNLKRKKISQYPQIDDAFSIAKPTSASMDACVAFGQYVATKLRTYEPRTRACVEQAISNVLYDAEMGKYDSQQVWYPVHTAASSSSRAPSSPSYSLLSSPILKTESNLDDFVDI